MHQTLESKALRKRLGLHDEHGGGVRISALWSPVPRLPENLEDLSTDRMKKNREDGLISDSEGLELDDVLLSIDGIEVGQDGTIPLSESRPHERIGKSYLITRNRIGRSLKLDILRSGKPISLQTTLRPSRYLCPVYDSFDACPSYVICGGCVFVPLSWPW